MWNGLGLVCEVSFIFRLELFIVVIFLFSCFVSAKRSF